METIRQYILSVCAAAVLCGILCTLFQKKSTFAGVLKLLTGMFLVIVLISPLVDFDFPDNMDFFGDFISEAAYITESASDNNEAVFNSIIKEKIEAYILDKALKQGIDAEVLVELEEDQPPTPQIITIICNIPPLARQTITEELSEELGVSKENIIWKSSP